MKKLTKWFNSQKPVVKNKTLILSGVLIGVVAMAVFNPGNIRNKTLDSLGLITATPKQVERVSSDANTSPTKTATKGENDPSNTTTTVTNPKKSSDSNSQSSSSNDNTGSSNNSGSGSSNSSSTPPSQPSTLANCIFVGGPRDGQACPASAPTSWSYSTPCYGNGSGLPCPAYSQTGWITASYQNGATYCEFDFRGDGNTTGAQYKRVRVASNNGANAPDCMTAYPM